MTVEVRLAELRTIIEQTLGPDGAVTKKLDEVSLSLKEGAKVMHDHALRIDRLEQSHKTRSKLAWTLVTASVGMFVTALWNLIKRA